MKRLGLLGAILLIAGAIVGFGGGAGTPIDPVPAIDPRVLEDTANGGTGHFLVVLKDQADTRAAASRSIDLETRGRLVFDALRQTASASQPSVIGKLTALGAIYHPMWIVNLVVVEGNRSVVDSMAARPDVKSIESDRAFRVPLEPPENLSPAHPDAIEWNISKINAPGVWANGFRGAGTVFASADTGVTWSHPALIKHYRGLTPLTAAPNHNYNWWDAIHSDISGNGTNPCGFSSKSPCDDYGHGTHTTGTAIGDDGSGNQIGVAPGATWIACRNMDEGVGRPSTYIECLQFFLAPTNLSGKNPDPSRRPDAIGNSYGCPPSELCSPNSLLAATDNERAAGIFMSVAAGNSGSGCSTVTDPPSLYDSAITVGATSQSDALASFSSRGPVTVDGSNRRKPDLSAPGVGVRSSFGSTGYASLSGTSMATPHVAGAALLLWNARPNLKRNVDATELALESTANQSVTASGTCGGTNSGNIPNNLFGYGRIDVLAAVNSVPAAIFRHDFTSAARQ